MHERRGRHRCDDRVVQAVEPRAVGVDDRGRGPRRRGACGRIPAGEVRGNARAAPGDKAVQQRAVGEERSRRAVAPCGGTLDPFARDAQRASAVVLPPCSDGAGDGRVRKGGAVVVPFREPRRLKVAQRLGPFARPGRRQVGRGGDAAVGTDVQRRSVVVAWIEVDGVHVGMEVGTPGRSGEVAATVGRQERAVLPAERHDGRVRRGDPDAVVVVALATGDVIGDEVLESLRRVLGIPRCPTSAGGRGGSERTLVACRVGGDQVHRATIGRSRQRTAPEVRRQRRCHAGDGERQLRPARLRLPATQENVASTRG